MVDDFQFMGNKGTTQEEFFHTFSSLVEEGKQVIISADKSPTDLDGIEERLKSRLVGGLVVDIMPTNFELRMGILQKKAELMGIDLPQKVAEFLAQKDYLKRSRAGRFSEKSRRTFTAAFRKRNYA